MRWVCLDALVYPLQILTGKGPIGQVAQETSLPTSVVELLFLGIIAYSVIGGLNPASPTFSEENQRDVRKRKPGWSQYCIARQAVITSLIMNEA